MSKSPAALSGPLLFWRRREHLKTSQNQSTSSEKRLGNGRIPTTKPSLRKTDQPGENEKQ